MFFAFILKLEDFDKNTLGTLLVRRVIDGKLGKLSEFRSNPEENTGWMFEIQTDDSGRVIYERSMYA